MLVKNCRRARARKPDNQLSLALSFKELLQFCIIYDVMYVTLIS